jgi:hypothetical protein
MFGSILSWLSGPIINSIFGPIVDIAKAYINKEVSETEAKQRMVSALTAASAQVEVSHSEALAKTYASFTDAMKGSVLMTAIWSTVVITQLFVLLWHQMGIPAVVYFSGSNYPSSGSTVDWAYLLIAACLGLGPAVLRSGPAGPGGFVGTLKSLIGK